MFTSYKFLKKLYVNSGGNVGGSGSNRNLGVRSALFLKSDVEILSGDGTNDNPFVLE